MDSGVGQLMQGLVGSGGDGDRESVEPTPMGQGVGSLDDGGRPCGGSRWGLGSSPSQILDQGGVVQRFEAGGEASRLQSLYSEMLPVYQSILGDGEEQRRMTQAQILF
jgi:hypothetical protein